MIKVLPVDRIIWLFFTCWILIDSTNGFLRIIGVDFPFSQLIKFGVFILVLMRLIRLDRIKVSMIVTVVYLLFVSIHVFFIGNDVKAATVLILKPLTTLFFFYYFKYFSNRFPVLFSAMFNRLIFANFIFLAVNIAFGLMGYGNHVYDIGEEEGVGIKGFIISQNEISLVVAILYPMLLLISSQKYNRLIYYLIGMAIGFISFCISTKASIIISFVSFIFVSIITGTKTEKKWIVLITSILLLTSVSYMAVVLSSEIGFIQRFSYFMENRGLLDAIFSGRLDQLETESNIFFGKTSFLSQLLGQGEVACELDPFQALFSFGYIGGILNVVLLMYLFFRLKFKYKKNEYEKVLNLSNTLIVLLSLFSGHVFFSSMGGLFMALSNAKK